MPATADVRSTRARAGNGRNGEGDGRKGDGDDALLADVLEALDALGKGDFTVRMSTRANGRAGQVAKAFNRVADLNSRLSKDLGRVGRVVGREGRMTERLALEGAGGSWDHCVDSVNRLIDDLVRPTNEVARVLQAVAQGDLTQKMSRTIEGQPVKGEFARIGTVVNGMVDQLGLVHRRGHPRRPGGGHRGQARRPGQGQGRLRHVEGPHRLGERDGRRTSPSQVRNIAQVTTAVAKGDLSQKITVDARGEILALKNTINTMVDQLAILRRRGHPRGPGGGHRGQARRPGPGARACPGTWRDLTDSVNFMAVEPHHPGAEHRPGGDRRGPGRPVPEDHGRGQGRGGGPGRDHQLHDRHPAGRSPTRSPAWPGRWAPRASSAARPRSPGVVRHVEGPHRLGELHGRRTSPARCATSPR